MSDPIVFVGHIPPLKSAFNFDGEDGAGGQLKVAFDGSQLPELLKLLARFRGKLLKITVEEMEL